MRGWILPGISSLLVRQPVLRDEEEFKKVVNIHTWYGWTRPHKRVFVLPGPHCLVHDWWKGGEARRNGLGRIEGWPAPGSLRNSGVEYYLKWCQIAILWALVSCFVPGTLIHRDDIIILCSILETCRKNARTKASNQWNLTEAIIQPVFVQQPKFVGPPLRIVHCGNGALIYIERKRLCCRCLRYRDTRRMQSLFAEHGLSPFPCTFFHSSILKKTEFCTLGSISSGQNFGSGAWAEREGGGGSRPGFRWNILV